MLSLSMRGVVKQYRGGVRGFDDFSLDVGPGVLGLLGPNGAGKSTLMRILATVTRGGRRATRSGRRRDCCRGVGFRRRVHFGAGPRAGCADRDSTPFEAIYIVWWYTGPLQPVPVLDFMGTSDEAISRGMPLVYFTCALGLWIAATLVRRRRLRT